MIVEVAPRLREYEPYAFWLLGASTAGYGDASNRITPEQLLAKAWEAMIYRCYDLNRKDYSRYGAVGVSVCKRWHTVSAYIEDVQKIHGWRAKLLDWNGYQLDKDYYSSNQYSPDTCVWLSNAANMAISGSPVYVTDTLGVRTLYLSHPEAATALGINTQSVHMYVHKYNTPTKGQFYGYKFEPALDAGNKRHQLVGEGT